MTFNSYTNRIKNYVKPHTKALRRFLFYIKNAI